jgi:hypothetical protein
LTRPLNPRNIEKLFYSNQLFKDRGAAARSGACEIRQRAAESLAAIAELDYRRLKIFAEGRFEGATGAQH